MAEIGEEEAAAVIYQLHTADVSCPIVVAVDVAAAAVCLDHDVLWLDVGVHNVMTID